MNISRRIFNHFIETSDPIVRRDYLGHCDYCKNFDASIQLNWHTGPVGERKLAQMANELQQLFVGSKTMYCDYKKKFNLIVMGAKIMHKIGIEKRYFR